MSQRHTVAALLGLVFVMGGCVQTPPPTPSDPPADTQVSEPQPGQDTEESGDEDETLDGVTLAECGQTDQVGIENTITAQADAFADGDVERAYTYASDSFQSAVPLDVFRALIDTRYGPLIAATQLQFDRCLIDTANGSASVDVRFTSGGDDLIGLRYLLSESDQGWRVDGASGLEQVGGAT